MVCLGFEPRISSLVQTLGRHDRCRNNQIKPILQNDGMPWHMFFVDLMQEIHLSKNENFHFGNNGHPSKCIHLSIFFVRSALDWMQQMPQNRCFSQVTMILIIASVYFSDKRKIRMATICSRKQQVQVYEKNCESNQQTF